jgi:hypothetical protein
MLPLKEDTRVPFDNSQRQDSGSFVDVASTNSDIIYNKKHSKTNKNLNILKYHSRKKKDTPHILFFRIFNLRSVEGHGIAFFGVKGSQEMDIH